MTLSPYRQKRNFRRTPEPKADANRETAKSTNKKRDGVYVIQKHRASHLHYDFRLEFHGVLLSWAIPKGPSLDPSIKRLAMQVEDHPMDYAGFEGVIPEGQYGGGTVMVWDRGSWTAESDNVETALRKGDLKFTLHGKKLRGSWVLVRTGGYGGRSDRSWLLIKHKDRFACKRDITEDEPRSVISRRLLAGIASENGGNVRKASQGDPGTTINRRKKRTKSGPEPRTLLQPSP